jgi:hypothetical protein
MKISELQASNQGVYNTDKTTGHSYGDFYDELFAGKLNHHLDIMEVGIYRGGSVRLFHDLLPNAFIYGCDIVNNLDPMGKRYYERTAFEFLDAYSGQLKMPHGVFGFDVIIDDGSHTLEHQIYALTHFHTLLKSGGIMVIEDVPEGAEQELIKHAPSGGKFWIENLRHVKGRWDDCLVIFKKD